MKRIRDERLIVENLKNIRIAYLIQTIGIISILVYDGIRKGVGTVVSNPLWLVLVISSTVLIWKGLKISEDMEEDSERRKQRPYAFTVGAITILSIGLGILTKFTSDNKGTKEGIIMGIVVFICFIIPYSIIYHLRRRRLRKDEEEEP